MLPEHLKQNFVNFHNSMVSNGILDPKTTVMIQLGAAMALGCYPCMTALTRVAEEKDVNRKKGTGAVISLPPYSVTLIESD